VRAEREREGYSPTPPLVIVTARASLATTLPVFTGDGARTIVATTADSAARAQALGEVADIVVAGEHGLELPRLLAALDERGLHRILCEGGPFLLSRFVEDDLVDDLCLTLSPFLAGSQPTTQKPPSSLTSPVRLALRHVLTHDDLLYLRYSRP
jgi:riboflavin biosynthesis pyrimidine reductase